MRNVLKSLLVAALATGGAALVLKALALDAPGAADAPRPDGDAPDFMNMSDEELENMSDEQMLDALMGELSSYV
jgi:hypothetical protein